MKLFHTTIRSRLLAALLLAGVTAASAAEVRVGEIVVTSPWSRQSPKAADVAGGFLAITNSGKEDDRLLKATADITDNVQLHDMKIEGDVMKMVELPDGIPVPAGQTVELKPGSLHVMFIGIKKPVTLGEKIKGTLVFQKAGTVNIEYEVKAANANMN